MAAKCKLAWSCCTVGLGFRLAAQSDGPVNRDKASAQVGAQVGEVVASSLKGGLLKVVGWMNEGTSKTLDGAQKAPG